MKIKEVIVESYGGYGQNQDFGGSATRKKYVDGLAKEIQSYIAGARRAGQATKVEQFIQAYLAKYNWQATPEQSQQVKQLCAEIDKFYNLNPQSQQATPTTPTAPTSPTAPERVDPTMTAEGLGDWAMNKMRDIGGSIATTTGFGPISKLANLIYMIGMEQVRDPRTGRSLGGFNQQQPQPTMNTNTAPVNNQPMQQQTSVSKANRRLAKKRRGL